METRVTSRWFPVLEKAVSVRVVALTRQSPETVNGKYRNGNTVGSLHNLGLYAAAWGLLLFSCTACRRR